MQDFLVGNEISAVITTNVGGRMIGDTMAGPLHQAVLRNNLLFAKEDRPAHWPRAHVLTTTA